MAATLRVTRHTIGVEVRRRPFDVLVDGRHLGSIELGHVFEGAIEPGHHTLQIRSGRNWSPPRVFDVADGEGIAFNCSGKSILPVFLLSFFVPSLAISVRQTRFTA